MMAAAAMLLLVGCLPLAACNNFLPNAPMHVPRIGRRSDTEQNVGEPVRASKSLYYQLPRNYPRVGRRDPSIPTARNSLSERRASNDEQLLALWRRAAILDQSDRYDGRRVMDAHYDAVTPGKDLYEPARQYPSKDVATNEEKDDNEDLRAPYTRGLRYDGTFFRSLREERKPLDGGYGDTYPEGPEYGVLTRDTIPSMDGVAGRGVAPYNESSRGSPPYNCHGRECSPVSEPLERLVKSLLKEIILRRQQQAGEESLYRQTDADEAASVPVPRQLW